MAGHIRACSTCRVSPCVGCCVFVQPVARMCVDVSTQDHDGGGR
jgi:hypothetical protein